MIIARRDFLGLCAALAAIPAQGPAHAEELRLTDDGLHYQPWFLESFLELEDDLKEASAQGKRFAIMWEQRGCPYCLETHRVNFADPVIRDYIVGNFVVLQLNMFGARQVTDFDGEVLGESDLARKYAITFSPTIQFFPEDPAGLAEKAGKQREVARLPGYLRPPHFLAMFRYVNERAYETVGFRNYLKTLGGNG